MRVLCKGDMGKTLMKGFFTAYFGDESLLFSWRVPGRRGKMGNTPRRRCRAERCGFGAQTILWARASRLACFALSTGSVGSPCVPRPRASEGRIGKDDA